MIDPVTYAVLEAMDSYAMVLNPQRQILAANPILLEALDNETPAYQGLRLGEVLGCVHAGEGSDGCGSSRACRRCGALLSVLASQDTGQSSEGECCISIQKNSRWEAREFTARSLPLQVAGHQLTLITLRDISARKRQESLERIFIHDLMNTLHGLRGWTELLQAAGAEATTVAGRIIDLADHLTAEVESQRRLLQAECGELVPDLRPVRPGHILDELLASVGADSANRLIRLPPPPEAAMVRTDPVILCRILGNMVVNALEAVPMGALVRVWHEDRAGRPTFIVQNPGCMPPEVADRIFQRSFSTKASRGRGLGTYGMKVLGESVLGGKVGFTSDWEDGTRFFIELPGGG
jgi:signal transduction histidine kinase